MDGVCRFGELSGTNAIKMRVESVVVEDIAQLILIRSLLRSRTPDLSYMENRKKEDRESVCGSSFIYNGAKPISASEASPFFRKPLVSDR